MYENIQKCVDKLHGVFDRTDLEIEFKKLEHKFEEARYNPGAIRPLADCILSILLAARSRGFSVTDMLNELDRVSCENIARNWKKMEDGTYQAF